MVPVLYIFIKILELFFDARGVKKMFIHAKEVAHLSSFYFFGCHDNDMGIFLINHLPKIIDGILKAALRCNVVFTVISTFSILQVHVDKENHCSNVYLLGLFCSRGLDKIYHTLWN